MLNGMELAEKFYMECEDKLYEGDLAFLKVRTAVGLVGEGSECYGFDDYISRDHDFGPSFCLWLTDEDYEEYGERLLKRYINLPETFMGLGTRIKPAQTMGRVGVLKISSFYKSLIGMKSGPKDNLEWLQIKEFQLAAASNGSVFKDSLGVFSQVRKELLDYYPEDVRLKRLAAALANMAQSGQYNFGRCLQRSELGGAYLMKARFVDSCIKAIFLLNKTYRPFDKWAFKKMETLSEGKPIQEKLKLLISNCENEVLVIEEICDDVRIELSKQNLSSAKDDFLIAHAIEISQNIEDIRLRRMNMLQDEI